jgi:hypothetical protein
MTDEERAATEKSGTSSVAQWLGSLIISLLAGFAAGYAGAYFEQRNEDRHDISVSIIRDDSAVPIRTPSIFEDNPLFPLPSPTPNPFPVYTYTALVRNNGDFSESNTTISIYFQEIAPDVRPIAGPQIDYSSSLLAQMIQFMNPVEPEPNYVMSIELLNPGEWVSLKTTWLQPVRVEWDIRSEELTASSND